MTEFMIRRFPSIVAIAMKVAPSVRLGHLTDAEGRELVRLRYLQALAANSQSEPK